MDLERKPIRKTPKLDMNPMVDLAFLLVTFFMLTTTFKASEPFEITNPTSTSDTKLPSKDILNISVNSEGDVFVDIDNSFLRGRWLAFMGEQYGMVFDESEKQHFALMNSVGLPMAELQEFLKGDAFERSKKLQSGIPTSQENNELRHWVMYARAVNPMIRITINADENTSYQHIQEVIKTLTSLKIHRFNLITDKESQALQL
jgi:biopolymer transport protein ExbD